MKDVSKLSEQESRPILDSVRKETERAKRATKKRDDSIRQALADGVSGTELAKATGLSRQRIYQIKLEN